MILQPQSALGGPFGNHSYVAQYKSRDTTLQERCDIGGVRLTASVDLAGVLVQAIGLRLPERAGLMVSSENVKALWLGPRDWLIQCEIDSEIDIVQRLSAAFPDKRAHAVLYTDALGWVELAGPGALEVLTDGGFISLERQGLPLAFAKRTLLAQIPVLVLHQDVNQWLLGVERSRAPYFLQWLCSAAGARDAGKSINSSALLA